MARTGVSPGVDCAAAPPDALAGSDQVLFGVANRRVMAIVRVVVGVLWLSNLGWKTPTDFGVLHNYTRDAVSHPVVAPFSWFAQHVVLPHFSVFAWTTLFVETLLAASLLTACSAPSA